MIKYHKIVEYRDICIHPKAMNIVARLGTIFEMSNNFLTSNKTEYRNITKNNFAIYKTEYYTTIDCNNIEYHEKSLNVAILSNIIQYIWIFQHYQISQNYWISWYMPLYCNTFHNRLSNSGFCIIWHLISQKNAHKTACAKRGYLCKVSIHTIKY